jgi:DNA-damage-inducible protein D
MVVSVIDVIQVLTDSPRSRKYWADLKKKLSEEGFIEVSEKIGQLKLIVPNGKMWETDCANTETLFRIIQTIPSPKAEPFKRWLAKVGYERIQEIEDPERTTQRTRALYKAKGYPDAWIEKRMRGIEQDKEFAILTAEITKATFGMTPSEYKQHKSLKRENLLVSNCNIYANGL